MNPVLTNLDYPDPDVIRVDDTYYMITTTMHFFPGGEILRSFDLVHWERVASVFDELEDDPAHRLDDGVGIYGKGMWAGSLRHHNGLFYVCFVANETHKTYLFRSGQITGPWVRSEISGFYHDPSLLFDGDRVFVAWGNTEIHLTELDSDLLGPRPGGLDRVVVRETGNGFLGYEGCHFYRIRGRYYLLLIHSRPFRWRRVQACFWADDLEGEFRGGDVLDDDLGFGDHGVAQGGLVDTPQGDWFSILFQDRGAVGRIPVLVPVTWDGPRPLFGEAGRVSPSLVVSTRPQHEYAPLVEDDDFRGPLKPSWQWNHQPDTKLWRLVDGQWRLKSARTAETVLAAPNTLTQRMLFPGCSAEVGIDGTDLAVGDYAGLIALQGAWGAVALHRTDSGYEVAMVHRPCADRSPAPLPAEGARGVVAARRPGAPRIRVRLEVSFSAEVDFARFWYLERNQWQPLGPAHALSFRLDHFVGCRFGLFLWATERAGGEVGFDDFRYLAPQGATP